MVKFYKGNTLSRLADKILSSIPKDATGRHVVIVPDRFTLSIEQKLARKGSLLTVEVLPFSRFARSVLGARAKESLTPEGCTMILSKAIETCEKDLRYYDRAVGSDGFVNEMYSALVSVRNSGITPTRLRLAAEGMKGRVADKTRDMAIMLDAYLAALTARYSDPTTLLQLLSDYIPSEPAISSTCFYFVHFYCFNKMQYQVIGQLMAYAKEVHIGYIAEDVGEDNRRIFPSDLRETLWQIAREKGVFCETVSAYEPLLPAKQALQNRLFGYGDEDEELAELAKAQAKESVRLFTRPTVREELQTVAAEISRLLRGGYRYRDFAVISADPEGIGELLEEVFDDYRIPVFRDRKVLLSQEPLVRYILDGIECLRSNLEWEKVMTFVKNPFFGGSLDEVAEFENYCRKYAIDHTRFNHPFTLRSDRVGEDDLETAEKVRARLLAALPSYSDCTTVHDYIQRIRDYQTRQGLDARFADFFAKQKDGFAFGAERTRQVPQKWRDLLDTFDTLLGQEQADLTRFLHLFQSALDSIKISLLPSSLDQVYIGEAKDSHYEGVKVMFVVDAVDGKLPAIPQSGSILSDAFYRALQLGDVVVYPSAKDQGRYSRFYLEQLLLLPDLLYVSYAGADASACEQRPSEVVESLSALYDLPIQDGLGHSLIERVGNREHAYKVLLREKDSLLSWEIERLQAILSEHDLARYAAVTTPIGEGLTRTEIFFRNDLTSISQLETYFGCPYQFFVKYGLGAKERKEAQVDANEVGNVIHRVLELLFGSVDVDNVTEEELDDLIEGYIQTAIDESRLVGLTEKEYASRIRRLKDECRYIARTEFDLVKQSRFRPIGTEIRFGGKDAQYPAIDLSDGVRLKGIIDRVDRCGDYISVVDYKSGEEHSRLKHVYYGHKFQLYAYLGALRSQGFRPVGAFYKKVSGRYRPSYDKTPPLALKGQVVDDPTILSLFEPNILNEDQGRLLPFRRSKGALVPIENKDETALSEKQLNDVVDYVDRLMKQAVRDVKDGYIVANPAFDACKYCQACDMCPQGKKTPERKTSEVKPAQFDLSQTTDQENSL